MSVAQLVSLFETLSFNPEAEEALFVKPLSRSFRNHSSSAPSSRTRQALQTIFHPNLLHRLSAKSSSSSAMSSPTASSSSSVRTSPSASYSSFRSPARELHNIVAVSPTLSASSPTNFLRRQPSAIDLALEQERYADHAELLGLGLLEPRPRANTSSSTSSQPCSMMEFMHESMQTPVVLDGIFEVLERA